MTDVAFARSQMGASLAFHIVFAAIGIAMPVCMVISELRWRKTGDAEYLALTRSWAKGTAVLFAVGAVSGTVLSFELGLLFPTFMQSAGAIIGMPFSLEGFAFFTEAIFLGIYLYGWDRISPRLHVAAGVIVCLSGLLSAVFVVIANAWMNVPRGFTAAVTHLSGGRQHVHFSGIDPIAAMATPFALHEIVHMLLAAYMATGFTVAAIHAWALLRRPHEQRSFHVKALGITLAMAIPCALAQPLVGHFAGHEVAKYQPMKLAAVDGLERTQARAPLHVGPFEVPGALSLLAFNDPDAVVQGLDQLADPRDRPPSIVRVMWQGMIGIGMLLAGLAAWALWRRVRRRPWEASRRFLWAVVLLGPLGFVAVEAGWMVTELGRQPWVIYGVLRTVDAATPMPYMAAPFLAFAVIYLGLSAAVVYILKAQIAAGKAAGEHA